jgi:tetratricopeptide (TPR) repeat protein
MPQLKKRKVKALADDVKKLPPLFLLAVAECIKYRHKFIAANVLCRAALNIVDGGQESTTKGLALLSVGHAYWGVDDYTPAETHLRRAKSLLEKLSEGPFQSFYLMRSILLLGDTLVNLDRQDEAEALAHEAEALIKKCRGASAKGGTWDRLVKKTHSWRDFCRSSMIELGELYYYTSCWEEGEKLLGELVPMLVKEEGTRHGRTIEAQRDLASMLVNQDKYEEAEKAYRLARDWHQKNPTFGREEQGAIDYNIAMCLSEQGRNLEAMEELERLDVAEDLFHYANGDWTLKLARTTHMRLNQYDEVVNLCRRFEDVLTVKFGKTGEITMKNLVDWVTALLRLSRYEEAITVLRDMRERQESDAEHDPLHALDTQRNLAHALRLIGKYEEAAYQFRKCIERAEGTTWSESDASTRDCLEHLAYIYERGGDRANATIAYSRLQGAYLRRPKTETNVMRYLWFRGKLFAMNNKPGHACAMFRKALGIVALRRGALWAEKIERPLSKSYPVITVNEVDEMDEEEGQEHRQGRVRVGLSKLEADFQKLDPDSEIAWPDESTLPPIIDRNNTTGEALITGWTDLTWLESAIREAIHAARRGESLQSMELVPLTRIESLWKTSVGDNDDEGEETEETVDAYMSRVGQYPFAQEEDEWQAQPEFARLPDRYEDTKPRRKVEEWERDLFGDERADEGDNDTTS